MYLHFKLLLLYIFNYLLDLYSTRKEQLTKCMHVWFCCCFLKNLFLCKFSQPYRLLYSSLFDEGTSLNISVRQQQFVSLN